jgi:hypothetical protein
MNERIENCLYQAGLTAQGCWDELDDYAKQGIEKFAELIIKECARVARATPAPNFHEHLKQQLGHTWDMAAIEAGREIVKHFGVES